MKTRLLLTKPYSIALTVVCVPILFVVGTIVMLLSRRERANANTPTIEELIAQRACSAVNEGNTP